MPEALQLFISSSIEVPLRGMSLSHSGDMDRYVQAKDFRSGPIFEAMPASSRLWLMRLVLRHSLRVQIQVLTRGIGSHT